MNDAPDRASTRDDGRFYFLWMGAMVSVIMVSLTTMAVVFFVTDANRSGVAATAATPGARQPKCPASAGLTGTVVDKGSVYVGGSNVTVDAGDSFFDATCALGVAKGDVVLTVTNSGQILHNVSIPSLDIDENLSVGETVTVTVNVGDTPLGYFCKFHRTSGMVGSLVPA